MAAMQAVDAVEQGRHFLVEGEAGSGRRLLARAAWCAEVPAHVRCSMDCACSLRWRRGAAVRRALLQQRPHALIRKLNLAVGGGLLLLHTESLPLKAQSRLAQVLGDSLFRPRSEATQVMMTTTPSNHTPESFHPDLVALLLRIRVPALRERVEDIRSIAETFLHNALPFDRVRCSQALIDRFCAYHWPGTSPNCAVFCVAFCWSRTTACWTCAIWLT